MSWRPRAQVRPQKQRHDGRSVWAVGVRVGYWPCLLAPFIRLDIGPYFAEVYIGYHPSAKVTVPQ